MKGISPEGKCPVCKESFRFDARKLAFVCAEHKTEAKRFLVTVHFKGERIRRATNLDGETLTTFAQAHALLNQADTEKRNKRFDPKKWKSRVRIDYSFGTLIDKWLGSKTSLRETGQRAPSYVSELPTYINRFYLPVYEGQDVREIINLDECMVYISAYRKIDGKGISLKYRKNVVDTLQGFFHWLKRKKYIIDLPDFPDRIDVPEHYPQTISKEIRLQILSLIPDEHKPIFTWLFYQGCRPGEARALKGDCILNGKEPRDTVEYKRTFSDNVLMDRTKTKNVRLNYIFPEVRPVLPLILHKDGYVFTHGIKEKRPYSKPFLNKIFRKALENFNVNYGADLQIQLYEATKHSFGTEYINEGVSIHHLKDWFGHTSEKITAKYAKLDIVDVFRRLDNVISIEEAKTDGSSDRQ